VSATASEPAASYASLAPFYDRFTAHHDYESWTLHLEAAALKHGLSGRRLLDVACGTGKSFIPFLNRGYETTACDISPEMLRRAKAKAPDARLVLADMRKMPSLGRFDLITCLDDSLNYLLSAEEVRAAFRGIVENLAPTGICLFDLNTLPAYRTAFAGVEASSADGIFFFWQGQTADDVPPGSVAAASIEVFEPVGDSLYRRRTSRHVQRHYPSETVRELLEGAGLDCLAVYAQLIDGSLRPDGEDESTHKSVYVVRHSDPKGGEAE
jgi:SAM-dependent methyltransferase